MRDIGVGPRALALTPTEWHLLEVLLRHPGKLLSQKRLLAEVWGPATKRPAGTCGYTWLNCAASSKWTRADPATS